MLLNCGVGEDSWESLGLQGDPTIPPKRDQSWVFIGRTDAEAEIPILWPPDVKNWLTGKDPDAGKDCRQEEKGMTEDEMVGWHHRLNGHEFKQTLGVGDGQGSLACCGPWGCKESDMTEWLNWLIQPLRGEIRPAEGTYFSLGNSSLSQLLKRDGMLKLKWSVEGIYFDFLKNLHLRKQMQYVHVYVWNLDKWYWWNICREGMEMQS